MSRSMQASALRWVLLINASMFGIEFVAGWIAESTALIADSFDMLADALVYGLSLAAVSRTELGRARTAAFSGVSQLVLGLLALVEVGRRYVFGSSPEPSYMMVVAFIALLANVVCLRLIARHRHDGVHMQASWIFSQNDVLANVAVIAAGALVAISGHVLWDLAVGVGIAFLVGSGGYRILRRAAAARRSALEQDPG